MQATRDATQNARLSLDPKASRLPEYVYQVAILLAALLVIWTVA